MAGEDKVLKVLLQIQSDISDLGKLQTGVEDLKKSLESTSQAGFSLGDAFKFAGAEEALRGVLDAVKEVGAGIVEFVQGSVEKAAELQTEAFPINQLLGNAEKAKEIIGGLDSAWQEFGVVSNEALANAARNLIALNTPAENLIPRLTEMVKIHLAFGVSLEDVTSAYARFQTAIMNNTEVMTRGMGGFGLATNALLQLLEDHFGKTKDRIQSMLKAGQISLQDLIVSMREAASAGGRLFDVIEQKRNTFDGAFKTVQTAWQGLEAEFGKPIGDALTPLLQQYSQLLKELFPLAEEVGSRIGNLGKEFGQIAQQEGWENAIRAAWETLMAEIAVIIRDGIESGFDAAINVTGIQSEAKAAADIYHETYAAEYAAKIAEGKTKLQADWSATQAATWAVVRAEVTNDARLTGDAAVDALSDAVTRDKAKLTAAIHELLAPLDSTVHDAVTKAGLNFQSLVGSETFDATKAGPTLGGAFSGGFDVTSAGPGAVLPPETPETLNKVVKPVDEVKLAMRELEGALKDVHQQQQLINQNPFLSADEKQKELLQSYTRELENIQAQIQKLNDLKTGGALDPAQLEEVNQKLQQAGVQVDLLNIKLKELKLPFTTELVQWANSFGSTTTQVFNTFKGAADAAFSSFNNWVVTGKFNLQGFLQQIELLGLKLLEQLAIQEIISIVGGEGAVAQAKTIGPQIAAAYAGAATAVSTASYGVAAGVGATAELAALGTITGALTGSGGFREGGYTGEGSDDDIAGVAHRMEFVFGADAVRTLGVPFLERLHRAAASGSDMSVNEAGRLPRGQGYDPIFDPSNVVNPSDATYTPAWMRTQQYWGDGPDNSRPSIPPENIWWNAPGGPPIGAPQVDTPTGPSDIPNENIGWNPPGMPIDIGGYPLPGFGDPNVAAPDWVQNATRGGAPWAGPYEPGSDYTTYGIVPGLGVANPTGFEDFIAASHGRSRTGGLGGTGGSLRGIAARHTGGLIGPDESLVLGQHGEFVLPKSSVEHYGLPAIEGLRSLSVPRSAVGSGADSLRSSGGGVHVYAFTDLKQIFKHMGSREGQKIIFDTMSGRRIDFGMRRK